MKKKVNKKHSKKVKLTFQQKEELKIRESFTDAKGNFRSKESEKRYDKAIKSYRSKGFGETALWSLDNHLAELILPRLKEFKKTISSKNCAGVPSNISDKYKKFGDDKSMDMAQTEWYDIIDSMINSFEIISKDLDYSEEKKIQHGLDLFAKHYRSLWW